ncbi:hypothetical protein CSP48_004013 [Salmonella enterica subsp. arizonae]|nr:hypothetical protein [Salmonella enterica subsp. arizonae]
MTRKRHQVTCRCHAYDFPHRAFGGACSMIHIVEENVGGNLCHHCYLFNDGCEVLKGQESPRECAYVQDFIEYHEVKL